MAVRDIDDTPKRRRCLARFTFAVGFAAGLLCVSPVLAQVQQQEGEARTIKVLVGFGAGGNPDVAMRHIARRLTERLGQPVVVENRPGATGTIAAASVARAAPDGHTLLFGVAANLAVAPAAMAKPPYDPVTAFTPIVEVARGPYLLLVRADLPVQTAREFFGWVRASGRANFASPGQGSAHHLAAEMLWRAVDLQVQHVPFASGMLNALIGGQVDVMLDNLPAPLAAVRGGRVRALGVTGPTRLEALPEVPTLAEQGVPSPEVGFWWGLVGPAGLPQVAVARLNTEVNAILREEETKALFTSWGIDPTGGTADAFGRLITAESARWRTFVPKLGLKLE
jgi:tripartite-type tricarboxylate transporter receptor subunit TctC